MADTETWTPADDDLVRSALASLRADTDALHLADPRFIRAKGQSRRRRTMLAWTAGAAAAAVVAATVGYAALGRNSTTPVPPATTSARPAPTTSAPEDLLATRSVLPLGAEWQRLLGLPGAAVVQDQPSYEGNLCQTLEPGTRAETQRVVGEAAQPDASWLGVQTRYTFATEQMARAGATTLAQGITTCAAPVDPQERRPAGALLPQGVRVWSYTKDGATGWLGVAQAGRGVTWLEVGSGTAAAEATSEADMAALTTRAQERLRRYATTPGPKTSVTTPPPRAANEDMPVSGLAPFLPSSLFVAAGQWASPGLTAGAETYAGPGAQEGSASVAPCETEEFQAGVGGRYGIVSVRSGGGEANYIGKQRVRLFEDVEAASLARTDVGRMDDLLTAGCATENTTVTATPGPAEGTYRMDTVFKDGSPTLATWVGVTTQKTEGAVSTIVLTTVADPDQGFAELERLMALARQK